MPYSVSGITASEVGIAIESDTLYNQSGIVSLDHGIQGLLSKACDALKLTRTSLPSGAWHDAGTVARQRKNDGSPIPVGIIFIPCRAGISHSPDEFSSSDQIARGASLLATAMLELACK